MRRVLSVIEDLGLYIACMALAALGLMTIADVIARALHLRLSLTPELGGYIGAALMFLPLAAMHRANLHIKADFFSQQFSPRIQQGIQALLTNFIFVAYVGVLLWICLKLNIASFRDGVQALGTLRVPVAWPQLTMVAGFALLFIELLLQIVLDIRDFAAGVGPATRSESNDTAEEII